MAKRRSAGLYLVALAGGERVAKPTPTRSQSTNREIRGSPLSCRAKRRSARPYLVALAGGELVAKPTPFFILLFIFSRRKTVRLSKKLAAVAIASGIALSATAAFAYWTTTGTGGGTGAAGSSNGTVVLSASVPNGIVPGGHVDVPVSATTTAGTDLFVTSVSLGSPAISLDAASVT